jgi:hypothetical protein
MMSEAGRIKPEPPPVLMGPRKPREINKLPRMDSNHDKVIQRQWWERQSWRRGRGIHWRETKVLSNKWRNLK